MLSSLIVLWFATIGADRIDFWGRSGSFILTPFLILSPLVISIGLIHFSVIHRHSTISLKVPKKIAQFIILIVILLIVVLLSIILGADAQLGSKRFVLLLFEIIVSFSVIMVLNKIKDPMQLLLKGSFLGILIYMLFSIVQFLIFLSASYNPIGNLVAIIDLSPNTWGSYAPRLSGMSMDQNRGGLLLIVYTFFILRFGKRSIFRTIFLFISFILLILTFSRSAIVSFLLVGVTLFSQNRKISFLSTRVIQNVLVSIIIVACFAIYFLNRSENDLTAGFKKMLSERLSVSKESSGGIHLALFERGLDVANASIKNALIGIGFGASYTVLDDFFQNNKYANFHSLYISILVEAGIISLIAFLFIYFYPALFSKRYLPLIIGIAFFNIFYQVTLEPLFWFCVILFWNNSNWEDQFLSNKFMASG